jgi:hypothetical protein
MMTMMMVVGQDLVHQKEAVGEGITVDLPLAVCRFVLFLI